MLISTCCFFSKKLKMSRDIISYRFCEKKKTRQKHANFSAANIHFTSYSPNNKILTFKHWKFISQHLYENQIFVSGVGKPQ